MYFSKNEIMSPPIKVVECNQLASRLLTEHGGWCYIRGSVLVSAISKFDSQQQWKDVLPSQYITFISATLI